MKERILSNLTTECPWRDTLYWYPSISSTNNRAKELAAQGAPQGTVLIAGRQTEGRGRMGRSFHSPEGLGLYLSLILRPRCTPDKLMHLTCAAAVAACLAIEDTTGYAPGIKWTNDLVAGTQKLGGILTEMTLDSKTGLVETAVVGIGINCRHTRADFPPELQNMATSLLSVTGQAPDLPRLAAAMVNRLWQMDLGLQSQKPQTMATYRKRCITLGKPVVLLRQETRRYATAVDLTDDGGLIVRFDDGRTETVTSGEVSVRGMYGYV